MAEDWVDAYGQFFPRVRGDGAEMKPHPYADILPLLEGEAFDALVADIRANGLLEPITLYEGMILDGRNRWNACKAAGVEPQFREFDGDGPAGVRAVTEPPPPAPRRHRSARWSRRGPRDHAAGRPDGPEATFGKFAGSLAGAGVEAG